MKYIDNRLNANIVKLKDANNNYMSENVEGALEEIDSQIKDIKANNYDDTQIKQDINNIKTEIGTEKLTTTNQTIKAALNEIDSQIEDIENKIEKSISEFGVVGLLDGSETDKIQNAINYCISNNFKLNFKSDKVYTINKRIDITKLEKDIDFNGCTIKAVSEIDTMLNISTVHMPLKNNKIRKIYNLTLDGNNKASTCITINQEHNLRLENINIKNFLLSGLKTNSNNYEMIFENLLIQGNGGIGMDINSSDNHFNNIIMFDCKYAVDNKGFNWFSKVHAWIYDTNLVEGSVFIKCQKSSHFNECYSDTYQKSFYITGNYNISINDCYLYCKETVYNKDTCPTAPYFLFFDNEKASAGVVLNGNCCQPLFEPINGSYGYFTNVTNFKGELGTNKFEKYSNIPIGIRANLTLTEGYKASYNRLIKKDGRVICEAKIFTDNNLTQGSKIIAKFPEGFKPKYDKTILGFIGYEWNLMYPIYCYINGSNGIQITIPETQPCATHIHLSFEYDTDVITDDILFTD